MSTESTTPRRTVEPNPGGGHTEYDDIPLLPGTLWEEEPVPKLHRAPALEGRSVEELGTLYALCHRLFTREWRRIVFGPCVQGAVFELKLSGPAERISMLDGYLTVHVEPKPAHFHLCIARHRGLANNPTPPELAAQRRCARAAFFRSVSGSCSPQSWGIRLWNGAGEQMLTFFLPNPYLSDEQKPRKEPDWSRLALWNELRAEYLGEAEPQPIPKGKHRFEH